MKVQLAFALFLCLLLSCATEKDSIPFEPVSGTDIDCSLIFSDSRKSIIELNEILIQIGIELGPNEANVAVFHVNGTRQELKLVKSQKKGNHTQEIYTNKSYKLELNYDLKYIQVTENAKTPYFEGDCKLWHDGKRSKMNVYGMHNML